MDFGNNNLCRPEKRWDLEAWEAPFRQGWHQCAKELPSSQELTRAASGV